jgi:hypothetical protein
MSFQLINILKCLRTGDTRLSLDLHMTSDHMAFNVVAMRTLLIANQTPVHESATSARRNVELLYQIC